MQSVRNGYFPPSEARLKSSMAGSESALPQAEAETENQLTSLIYGA